MEEKSFFDSFSPKGAFVAGLISAVLLLCTAGFVVLLVAVLSGKGITLGKNTESNGQVAGATVGADQPQAPTETVGNFRPVNLKKDHVRGDKGAKITLLEYSDLECPFCKKFHETMNLVTKANEGKINWIYRHFPLDGLHKKARPEAEASECAADQGKFWEFIDLVFQRTPSNDGLDLSTLPTIAKDAGVKDIQKFNKCVIWICCWKLYLNF